jgi:hypothetical protein
LERTLVEIHAADEPDAILMRFAIALFMSEVARQFGEWFVERRNSGEVECVETLHRRKTGSADAALSNVSHRHSPDGRRFKVYSETASGFWQA